MESLLETRIEKMKKGYNKVCVSSTQETTMSEIWISSPDGVKLRTIVVRPVGIDGPFSTIVIRSCYFKLADFHKAQAEELAKRGFAVVYQWCRGIGGSEGVWEPYVNERTDGIPLMNWLQEEEWVKNIGFVGASYLAMTGWFIADIVPDKVKTMYLTVLGTEQHTVTWQEGMFRQDIFTSWTMGNAGVPITTDYLTSAKYCPQIEVDEALWECRLDWYRDLISKPSRLDPYWTDSHWGVMQQVPGKMNIPIFLGEGWYDIQLGNSLEAFCKLSKASTAHSVLQVNPGNHGLIPVIPGQPHQEHASIDEDEQQLRWFRDILFFEKLPEPSVNYYLIGADEWRSYSSYPPNINGEVIFYLHGKELCDVSCENSCREYDYDPKNPVFSHGAETLFKTVEGIGSVEQPGVDWRDDVMSYVSEPLKNDQDIVGSIQAKIWVKSDAPDTCFTIKVMEVFPDGRTFNIRNGITSLAFRNNADTPLSYDGNPVEITIRCWDVAWRLKKGSRLRVDISSSNFPEFSVHPNTTTVWSMEANPHTAHQTILSGKDYPSKIILPVDNQ